MGRGKKSQEIGNDSLLDKDDGLEETKEDVGREVDNEIIKIKHEKLKDITIMCLDGIEVKFDAEGVARIEDQKVIDYLLSIPLYKKL